MPMLQDPAGFETVQETPLRACGSDQQFWNMVRIVSPHQ